MPSVAKALREGISRIGCKEAKAPFALRHEASVTFWEAMADLKRRLVLFEKENKQFQTQVKKIEAAQSATPEEPAGRVWISGKVVKSLRRRLGLSPTDFAKLVRISHQAVLNWEKKPGMLRLLSFS